jgi:hypothetical protein
VYAQGITVPLPTSLAPGGSGVEHHIYTISRPPEHHSNTILTPFQHHSNTILQGTTVPLPTSLALGVGESGLIPLLNLHLYLCTLILCSEI